MALVLTTIQIVSSSVPYCFCPHIYTYMMYILRCIFFFLWGLRFGELMTTFLLAFSKNWFKPWLLLILNIHRFNACAIYLLCVRTLYVINMDFCMNQITWLQTFPPNQVIRNRVDKLSQCVFDLRASMILSCFECLFSIV